MHFGPPARRLPTAHLPRPPLPRDVSACVAAIEDLTPRNRVSTQHQFSHYIERDEPSNVEVSAYSKSWPCLFPQHGRGRKHERSIALDPLQRELVERNPRGLLRGLVHSDGCRFMNSGRNWRWPRYSFKNRSDDIRAIFCDACDLLGVRWTTAPHTVYVSRKADVAHWTSSSVRRPERGAAICDGTVTAGTSAHARGLGALHARKLCQ